MIVESGFSRIPVYEGSVDNMVGLIFIKDVLRLLEKRQPVVLRKIRHPVHLVPETKKVGELLKDLQKRRTHMALVIDEHGSLTGLVTLEDLLEEIVGEIHDEYDWEERPVERLRDGSLVVDGTVSAAELRDRFQVPIPESDQFETVAGFMLDALGSVPRGGEVVALGAHRLTVVDVEKNRISKVKIDRPGETAVPPAAVASRASDRAPTGWRACPAGVPRRPRRRVRPRRSRARTPSRTRPPGPTGPSTSPTGGMHRLVERGRAGAAGGQALVDLERRGDGEDRDRPGEAEPARRARPAHGGERRDAEGGCEVRQERLAHEGVGARAEGVVARGAQQDRPPATARRRARRPRACPPCARCGRPPSARSGARTRQAAA